MVRTQEQQQIFMFFVFLAGMAAYSQQEFTKWEQAVQLNLVSPMAIAQHALQYLEKNESSAGLLLHSLVICYSQKI